MFSHEEIEFLAPRISRALAQAKRDERVRFHVGSEESRRGGILFVHHPLLQFTLTEFGRAGVTPYLQADQYVLSFHPPEARRALDTRQSWMILEPDFPMLAIDYELLGGIPDSHFVEAPRTDSSSEPPAPVNRTGPPAAGPTQREPKTGEGREKDDEIQSLKELVIKQATELERLKEEVRSLRQGTQRSDDSRR